MSVADTANDVVVVFCTAPDDGVADRIATAIVSARVAACVTILPPMRSVYRWQGTIERATEVQLLIKTRADRVKALSAAITAVHPYEVPEIIALPVSDGLPAYLRWVVDETTT
ncbi:MAG TPA: divalent-cation tolerance protein CutA [Myxococcota bacterium]